MSNTVGILLRGYLASNLIVGLCALGAWALDATVAWGWVSARGAVTTLRAGLVLAFVLPWLMLAALPRAAFQPTSQVFNGALRTGTEALSATLTLPAPLRGSLTPGIGFPPVGSAIALALLLVALAVTLRQYVRFALAVAALPRLHRLGRVEIRLAPENGVAASAWFPGRAVVLLPVFLLAESADRRQSLRHEFQHHRHGDPAWHVAIRGLCAVCFWNPALYLLSRVTQEWQELACDDALAGRPGFVRDAYAACVFRAAERALRSTTDEGAIAMAGNRSSTLRRRIERMYRRPLKKRGWWMPTMVLALVGLAGSAFAAAGWMTGPHVTWQEAQGWAERAQQGNAIRLEVSEDVVRELDRLLRTPEGHRWVTAAFERMPRHLSLVQRKLAEYGLPSELAALPLLESGYRNDLVSPGSHAAGLWQLIPATARHYSLRVEPGLDERTDVEKETDAAMHLLGDLHAEFRDWGLALKAYNEGADHVEQLIQKYGTRDAWQLEQRESREGYLSKAVAAIIVFRIPEAR